jgi:hypothetical protein
MHTDFSCQSDEVQAVMRAVRIPMIGTNTGSFLAMKGVAGRRHSEIALANRFFSMA